MAYRNGLRLLRLVNTLLDFSRIEAGRAEAVFEPVELGRYTAELASMFRSAMERAGIAYEIDCPALTEEVYVDRDMWEKIVMNLLSNAFKFTLSGGVRISVAAADGAAVLRVEDSGVGIAPDELPHVFERFHRVRGGGARTEEGTGIGLALVSELVKLHGGQIGVESTPGEGTTFSVSLPLGSAHLQPERTGGARHLQSTALGARPFVEEALRWLPATPDVTDAPAVASSGAGTRDVPGIDTSGARILLADDNADMRDYIGRILGDRWRVTAAADGAAALRDAIADPPDLILTDLMMPGADGLELLRSLRRERRTQTLPVILLSAHADEAMRVEGFASGADDYIVKPFSARELVSRVDAHLVAAQSRTEVANRWRALAEAMPAMITQTAADGASLYFSTKWTEYAGLTEEELIADWLRVMHPEDLAGVLASTAAGHRDGITVQEQWRARRRDGVYRWHLSVTTPIRGDDGRILSWVGTAIDIDDIKRSEEELRRSEARYRALATAVPALIVTTDARGEIEEISESYAAYTGLTREQARDWETHQVIHPDDLAQSLEVWAGTLAGAEPMQNEMRLRARDGTYRWHLVQAVPVRDEAGSLIRWVTISIDIDDRKRAESHARYLAETTARLVSPLDSGEMLSEIARLAVPALADICSIGLFDETTETVRVETAGADEREAPQVRTIHLRQWRAAPESDDTVSDVIARGDAVFVPEFSASWIAACAPDEAQRQAGVAVGARSLICVPLLSRGQSVGMATFATTRSGRPYSAQDLTLVREVAARLSIAIENVRLFDDLKQTAEDLQLANTAKDEFLSLVSHELRTPITVILGNSQVLSKRRGEIDELAQHDALHDISTEAERLNRIIENLLVLARMGREPAQIESVAVDHIVAGLVATHRKQHPHRTTNVQNKSQHVIADASDFCVEQVVRNLLSNAEKYSPNEAPIDVTLESTADEVTVSISDRGAGIDAAEMPRIFDPFYRSPKTRAVSGVGIGLTVCQRLIDSHSGRIWTEQREGGGTTMVFTLPAARDLAEV